MLLDHAFIFRKLDEYVFGQEEAKKNLTNTIFMNLIRILLDEKQRKKFKKKNVLLIGPTGSGKTELARALAEILGIPFCRVSATDFTLTGYKGSDPEEMITVHLYNEVRANLDKYWENFSKLLAIRETYSTLLNSSNKDIVEFMVKNNVKPLDLGKIVMEDTEREEKSSPKKQVEEIDQAFFDIDDDSWEEIVLTPEEMEKIEEAVLMIEEELWLEEQVDNNTKIDITKDVFKRFVKEQYEEALRRLEHLGKGEKIKYLMEYSIMFIDEFDKLFLKGNRDVEDFYKNLQKQLLTLIEGKLIRGGSESNKTGYCLGLPVSTENITFIAAGTFVDVNSDDLIGELKGRFPVITTIEELKFDSYLRILEKRFKGSSIFSELSGKWNVKVKPSALKYLAAVCEELNEKEYLGARRVDQLEYLIMNYINEQIFFEKKEEVIITVKTVKKLLGFHLSFDVLDKGKEEKIYSRVGFV